MGHRVPPPFPNTISSFQINNFAYSSVVVNILSAVSVLGEGIKETNLKVKKHRTDFTAIIKATNLTDN